MGSYLPLPLPLRLPLLLSLLLLFCKYSDVSGMICRPLLKMWLTSETIAWRGKYLNLTVMIAEQARSLCLRRFHRMSLFWISDFRHRHCDRRMSWWIEMSHDGGYDEHIISILRVDRAKQDHHLLPSMYLTGLIRSWRLRRYLPPELRLHFNRLHSLHPVRLSSDVDFATCSAQRQSSMKMANMIFSIIHGNLFESILE
jgi:hypothetical protein